MPAPLLQHRRLAASMGTGIAATGLKSGLQAAYTFENGGNLGLDSSLNANHLTNNNGATQVTGNAAPGTHGVGLAAASSQSLSIASNASLVLSGTSWELTCWVKFASFPGGFSTVIGKWGSAGGKEYSLTYNPNDTKLHAAATADGVNNQELTTVRPSIGAWIFLDMWFDAPGQSFFFNANNASATDGGSLNFGATSINAGTNPFAIGVSNFGGDFLDGAVDSVNVWKRILTTTERTSLFKAGVGLEYPFQ